MSAKQIAWMAGGLVALCVAILLVDYAVASRRAVQDDRIIKALQTQVTSDASLAPKLAAEQKRNTDARRARKFRDNLIAWVLIATAAVFLTAAKKVVKAPQSTGRLNACPTTATRTPAKVALVGQAVSPAPLDLTFIDQLVAQEGHTKESAIILLQAIQSHYRYLPDEALRRLCDLTEITPAEVAGTSSFYGQFRRTPVGKHIVRVCHGTACHVGGARQITEELRRHLNIPDGADTDVQREFTVDEVACLGCCSLAPVLTVDGHTTGKLTPATAREALTPLAETAVGGSA
jgi:NADH:ubiquinone oxidoreductase subunit E